MGSGRKPTLVVLLYQTIIERGLKRKMQYRYGSFLLRNYIEVCQDLEDVPRDYVEVLGYRILS